MKNVLNLAITICILFTIGINMNAQKTNQSNQIELGKVNWLRDYQTALEKSKQENKPILILFQEVPGCSTCRNYGKNVLSNGLLVDAIEHEFIPLAIHNNKQGEDQKILDLYNEPAWNNPVVRIVNEAGKDITTRISGNYTALGLANGMADALLKQGKEIPIYLNLLIDELEAQNQIYETAESYYQMYCFWSGEGHLGQKEGVLKTEPGFMDGHEVVKVIHNTEVLPKNELDEFAQTADCQPIDNSTSKEFRADKDLQYYLKNSIYAYLPLSHIQRTKINSALGQKSDPTVYLSPTQMLWLHKAQNAKNKKVKSLRYLKDISTAWWEMVE